MTRISTFSQNQGLLNELLRTQRQQAETSKQIATGKKVDQFKDLPGDTGVLMSARKIDINLEQYQTTSAEVLNSISIQDVQLSDIATAADDLRQLTIQALSVGSAVNFMEGVDSIFQRVVNIINSKIDGKYVYSGTRTDVPPVNVTSLTGLAALPSTAAAFDNNNLKRSAQVDDNLTIDYSFLADGVVTELFTELRAIKQFNDGGGGPLNTNLDAAQRAFLQSEVPNLTTTAENLNVTVGTNGRYHREITDVKERHEASGVYIKTLISDIEDVDLAEAVTRLNQDQLQGQATTQVLANLTRYTLLDYI